MTQIHSDTGLRYMAPDQPSGGGKTLPPGDSEPTPKQPKVPQRGEPVPSDPMAQGGGEEMPEGKYGTADIKEKSQG
jgi:hypothetical protein